MKDSKVFCILPWVHMQLRQTGDVYPCCRVTEKMSYGSTKENSIEQIWNSEEIKTVRKAMLSNEPQKFCNDCYNLEKLGDYSYRQMANDEFKQTYDEVIQNKNIDNKMTNLKFLDVRFSNVCNFKCRSCNPDSSSSWYDDYGKIYPHWKPETKILKLSQWNGTIVDEILQYSEHLEKIYFAGGEPLIDSNHYRLLSQLIEKKHTHILLSYNTNLSYLKFQDHNCLEIWKNFKNIQISASIDGVGSAIELIRKGAIWQDVYKNLTLIKLFCPHIKLTIYPTISVMNAFHITEIIKFFINKKIIYSKENFKINLLNDPDYLNINIMTEAEKKILFAHFENFLADLQKSVSVDLYEHVRSELELVVKFCSVDMTAQRPAFKKYTFMLDQIRHEKTVQVLPELFEILYG